MPRQGVQQADSILGGQELLAEGVKALDLAAAPGGLGRITSRTLPELTGNH